MARLRQKRKGAKWFLDYRDVDGTRFRVDTGTRDKKIADLWLKKVEELLSQARLGLIDKIGRVDADVVAGRKKRQDSLTLDEFKEYYEERCRHDLELAGGTIVINNQALESLKNAIGNKSIMKVTDNDAVAWKKNMEQVGKSKTTMAIYHRHLRAAFSRAVKWKLAEENPFSVVEVAKVKESGKKKNMSLDEVKALLAGIDESGEVMFANYVRFVLYTGCRRNEILFVRWEDIDLDNLSIAVRAQKTSKKLVLPINKALKRVIDGMEIREAGFVFQTKSGGRRAKFKDKPWHQDFVTHKFKEFVVEAELPEHYTLHSLRHTYATYLRSKGVPLDIVQRLLGHASFRTTEDHYDHSVALHFRAQADMIDFEE